MNTDIKRKLKAFWKGLIEFLNWFLRDGIDGVGISAGVLFRAYDFLAGSIYMSVYGWQLAIDGMKPVAAFLGFMISWGMFFVSHKLVKGLLNKEKWTTNQGWLFWIVIAVLGVVAFLGDSLFIDSGWVFLAFGIPEFNNPVAAGSLGIAFSKLSAMGWVFYITSAVMSGLSEFADAIFRHDGSKRTSVFHQREVKPKSLQWQPLPFGIEISHIVRDLKGGMLLVYGDDGQMHTVTADDPRVAAKEQIHGGQTLEFVS